MKQKIIVLLLIIAIGLINIEQTYASDGIFFKIKEYFAKKGDNMPEYQCSVHFQNFESSNYIQSSEECMPFFIIHKNIGHKCQIYSKFNEEKGIKQCNFCVDRFLSKTDKNIPKTCLEVKIEKTHFSEDEIQQIIEDNKDSIKKELNTDPNLKNDLKKCYDADTEVGRISYVQGKGFIQRSSRIIPAIVGEGLMPEDSISSDEDSIVTFNVEGKEYTLSSKERFQLPSECKPKEKGKISSFFTNVWSKIKGALAGDSSKALTATAGVKK
jgi:hypothetical protein